VISGDNASCFALRALSSSGHIFGVATSCVRLCFDRGRESCALNRVWSGAGLWLCWHHGLAAATLAVICTRISYGAAGTGPVWLEVRSKSAQILQFGGTTESRILVGQDASAAHVSDATLVSGVRRGIFLLSPRKIMCITSDVIAPLNGYPLRMCTSIGRKAVVELWRARRSVCVGLPNSHELSPVQTQKSWGTAEYALLSQRR